MFFTCGGCTNKWTAGGACHCSGCHQTFSVLSIFDKHRTGNLDHRRCLTPGDHPDKFSQAANGNWQGPAMTDEQRAARGFTEEEEA